MREAAELLFSARCMEQGYLVSSPLSGKSPYDVIVDCDGVLRRIQIKTSDYTKHGKYSFRLQKKEGRTVVSYTKSDCDFIVLHPMGTEIFVFLGPEIFEKYSRFGFNPSRDSDLINNFDVLCTPD